MHISSEFTGFLSEMASRRANGATAAAREKKIQADGVDGCTTSASNRPPNSQRGRSELGPLTSFLILFFCFGFFATRLPRTGSKRKSTSRRSVGTGDFERRPSRWTASASRRRSVGPAPPPGIAEPAITSGRWARNGAADSAGVRLLPRRRIRNTMPFHPSGGGGPRPPLPASLSLSLSLSLRTTQQRRRREVKRERKKKRQKFPIFSFFYSAPCCRFASAAVLLLGFYRVSRRYRRAPFRSPGSPPFYFVFPPPPPPHFKSFRSELVIVYCIRLFIERLIRSIPPTHAKLSLKTVFFLRQMIIFGFFCGRLEEQKQTRR